MKSSLLHTLIYAAALATVCSVLLTAAAKITEKDRKVNKDAEEKKNILRVLGVPFDKRAKAPQVQAAFNANVRKSAGRDMYEYVPANAGGEVRAVAVPFAGRGLWGPVKGFLALDPELKTIRGISFYDHEETPGLGGEISADWFKDQFKGKSIRGAGGKVAGIGFYYGRGERGANAVDAITGATMTCRKVEEMLNKMLNDVIEPIVREHRENGR